jgi:hypothetical protein
LSLSIEPGYLPSSFVYDSSVIKYLTGFIIYIGVAAVEISSSSIIISLEFPFNLAGGDKVSTYALP